VTDGLTRGRYVEQRVPAAFEGLGGRATRRAASYRAFVPAPVADIELALSGPTAADVADAERALVELQSTARAIAGFESLARMLLRSEAVASSWIEAVHVSHRKLAEAEHGAPGAAYDEARRVVANVRAMVRAVEIGASQDRLDVDDLLSMHGMLMSGSTLPIDQERAGKLRQEPVFIGGTSPQNAEYVGPPHELLPELLADLVEFVNSRDDLSPVVQAAIAHVQFESIHPFHDGNGRVGRCLVHTVLRRGDLIAATSAPISVVLARYAGRYVDGLTAFRRDEVDEWISLFANAVRVAAEGSEQLGLHVAALEDEWVRRLNQWRAVQGRKAVREQAGALRLIQALPGMPVFQIRDVADHLSLTWKAAETGVLELAESKVIASRTAGRRNRVFEAAELFALVDEFERTAQAPSPHEP
jgi:Fic family protein